VAFFFDRSAQGSIASDAAFVSCERARRPAKTPVLPWTVLPLRHLFSDRMQAHRRRAQALSRHGPPWSYSFSSVVSLDPLRQLYRVPAPRPVLIVLKQLLAMPGQLQDRSTIVGRVESSRHVQGLENRPGVQRWVKRQICQLALFHDEVNDTDDIETLVVAML
jgi:hypothetical protein